MAMEALSSEFSERIKEDKKKRDSICPVHIEIEDEVVYFVTSPICEKVQDNISKIVVPETRYAISKSEIRNLLGSI